MVEFNTVTTNVGDTIRRAAVPGGWLVLVTSDVIHITETVGVQSNYDWRTSSTFVPDQYHLWEA